MKVDLDKATVDRLLDKRATEFKKKIRDLEVKLSRRDNKIKRLQKEIKSLKAEKMDTEKETADRIAKAAHALVSELQKANWVENYYECGEEHLADEYY